jgi:hypothetical protein
MCILAARVHMLCNPLSGRKPKLRPYRMVSFGRRLVLFLTLSGRQKEILSEKRRSYLWCEVEACDVQTLMH